MRQTTLSQGGRIITIEGIDAVGKHTQTLLLEAWLKKTHHKVATLSFPDYETVIGKEIRGFLSGRRDFPKELQHILFAANRWEKASLISRYLDAGNTVVINRYSESNIVYGFANGLSLEWLMSLERGLPKADLVIVLDAPAPGLLSRRRRTPDSYEKNFTLQHRARKLYIDLAPRFGWKVIDASEKREAVHESIVELVGQQVNSQTRGERY